MNSKKRIYFLSFCLFVAFGFVLWRLASIQLLEQESFGPHKINLVEKSLMQRTNTIPLSNGRGEILDRNGFPLMNEEKEVLLLLPFVKHDKNNVVKRISQILQLPVKEEERLSQQIDKMSAPFVFARKDKGDTHLTKTQFLALQQLNHPGIVPIKMQFEQSPTLAQHALGMVKMYKDMPNQVSFISGINEDFNMYLQGGEVRNFTYHADGKGGSLGGESEAVSAIESNAYSIITTIDLGLQKRVEKVLDEVGMDNGAVILLDIQDSEVLAMASRPLMNVTEPFDEDNLDKVTRNQKVGSVFKTVVLAAAVDNNLVSQSETFDCNRGLDDQELADLKQQGVLNLESSFAKSCNRAFGEIGTRLAMKNPNLFEEYAKKLGMSDLTGWKGVITNGQEVTQFSEEEIGTIFGKEKEEILKTPRSVMSTSIGQQNVQFSPLAVSNLMATIARGGEAHEVKIVKSLISPNGNDVITLSTNKMSEQPLQTSTIKLLQKYLRSVVIQGTGQAYGSLPYTVAGKSGTAQTGRYTYIWNDELKKDLKVDTENKWFAGYFPYEKPRYALVVLNKDAVKEDTDGRDVFSRIVKEVYDYNQKK